jgi:hypothetical protein
MADDEQVNEVQEKLDELAGARDDGWIAEDGSQQQPISVSCALSALTQWTRRAASCR